MDIAVLDFTYTLLGPATAMAEAGHRVRMFAPDNPRFVRGSRLPVYHQMLLARLNGGEARPLLDADLVVYAESFADCYWALLANCQMHEPLPADPLAVSIHPLQLERRLDVLAPLLTQVPALTVVDMSDLQEPVHPAFAALPGRKLKRECTPAQRAAGITPFPFLYNPLLVALELTGGEAQYMATPAGPERDGWFCGTIDHWRYGGRRSRCLERILGRHPHARFEVREKGVPALENLRQTQLSRSVLHPPGRGEICFRTHEALHLGVPPLVAEPFRVCMANGHERIFVEHLDTAPATSDVRAFYGDCFRPAVAASMLMDAAPPATSPPVGPLVAAVR